MLHLPVLVMGRGEDYSRDCWSSLWWLLYGSAALNSQLESLGCCGVVRQRGAGLVFDVDHLGWSTMGGYCSWVMAWQ